MVFTLLGYAPVSFTDRSTGNLVEGVRFFFSGYDGYSNLVGSAAFDFFMTQDRLDRIRFHPDSSSVGTEFDIQYNRFGKIASIKSLDDSY